MNRSDAERLAAWLNTPQTRERWLDLPTGMRRKVRWSLFYDPNFFLGLQESGDDFGPFGSEPVEFYVQYLIVDKKPELSRLPVLRTPVLWPERVIWAVEHTACKYHISEYCHVDP